jgi:hypothetical protein
VEILKRHSGQAGVSRTVVLIAVFALAALLAWLLWPIRVTLDGSGTIQPRFESLVRITPTESGMVCRVLAERFQKVRAGEPLFEYIPAGKFSVLSYVRMTPPGGVELEPEPLPDWYKKVERERIDRIEAANRWSGRVLSQGTNAHKWESDLASRLAMAVPREADLVREQAQQRENVRLGRENSNKVYTFDETIGESVPTEQGIPLASPITGTLFSFWVQPQTQIFGSPSEALPIPQAGSPPMTALYAATSSPVGEIIPSGTPLEVLALIPVPPHSLHMLEGWEASLLNEGRVAPFPAAVTKFEIGRVSINPADARLVLPELPAGQESVFVRLSLEENSQEKIGTAVQVRLVSPSRPRAWFWLKKEKIGH